MTIRFFTEETERNTFFCTVATVFKKTQLRITVQQSLKFLFEDEKNRFAMQETNPLCSECERIRWVWASQKDSAAKKQAVEEFVSKRLAPDFQYFLDSTLKVKMSEKNIQDLTQVVYDTVDQVFFI